MKARYIFLALTCCIGSLIAQPITVSVLVRNPAPVSLQTWRTDPSIVRVTLTNTGSSLRQIVIGILLTNRTTGQTVRTDNMHPCMPQFQLAPGETRLLDGPALICENALVIDPTIRTSIIAAGAIPEGDYEFCVTVIDATDRRTELATTGVRCATSRVIWPDPPVLIRPLAGDAAQRCDQAILLQWQPLTPTPIGGVRYRIRAVGMFEGQLPRQALEAATATETIVDQVVSTTSYTIAPNTPVILDLVQRRAPRLVGIAWQVEAQDDGGRSITTRGGTRGKSDIGQFTLTCPDASSAVSCNGPMTLEGYYPTDRDTIPWVPPQLVVQWGPYCDDVLRMQFTLTVHDESSGRSYRNSRTLSWPRGPIDGQSLTGQANAQERARLAIVNSFDDRGEFVEWNNQLRRGGTYRWNVMATFTRREGRSEQTYTPSTAELRLNLGLRMPTEPNPANGATVSTRRGLTLRWMIPPPTNIVREYLADLISLRGTSRAGMMFGAASEAIRVVVARDSAFRTLVGSRLLRFPDSGTYPSFDDRVNELFGAKSVSWSDVELADGEYFWRVEYCEPTDTSQVYRRGPVWRFRVGSSVSASECIRMRVHAPEHRATVTMPNNGGVRFSIAVEPAIRLSAITQCRVRIWQMSRPDEDPAVVRSRSPLLNAATTTSGGRLLLAEPTSGIIELRFINVEGAAHTFTATNGQTYLWECELQYNGAQIRADGTPCEVGRSACDGIFTFRVSECNSPCEAPLPSNTTPYALSLGVGDVIRIGHFEAELTRVSGAPENLSGEALVRLPWMGIRIRTSFSGIAVNTDRQVYRGRMDAMQASGSALSQEEANRLSSTLGLSTDQLTAIDEFITSGNRFVSAFVANQPVELPIGFDRTIEGFRIAVGIVGMVFEPTGARLNIVHVQPMPWLGPRQSLGFGVRNICFSPHGLGRSLDIYLASDVGYRASDDAWAINFKAPQAARAGMPADSGTYVRITCGGFEFLRIAAEVEFPRSWMVPAPDDGTSEVILRFTTQVRRSGDFLATATMTPFSPCGASGFVFHCENVAVDLSDRENPIGIAFPSGYRGETSERWRGFYLGRLFMQFPEGIRGWSSTEPPRVEITNVIIDERTGLNFRVMAANILRYPNANLGGWGASLDTIGLEVVNSSLQRGWMSGKIQVPISDSALTYSAILRDSVGGIRFEFSIVPRSAINVPLWAATLQIDPTSWIRLDAGRGVRGGFRAQANFDGRISFGGTSSVPLNLGGIRFEGLLVRTDSAPYISVRSWSFASPPHSILGPPEPEPPSDVGSGGTRSAGGFPISIREFSLVSGSRREGPGVGVRIGVDVNLQSGGSGISGGTTISIWGAFRTGSSGPPSFVFSGIDLDSIGVRADMGAVLIQGFVRFYNGDPTYGNGFRGAVQANFVRMVEISATVQFGTVRDFRYWYVDARALITSGIPVFSGVGIYGFGGGAWYNMRRVSDPASVTPTRSGSTAVTASTGAPGVTNSGARYEPYYSSSGETFGFYALVTLGTHPEPKAFNCDVRLEVSFVGGGIHEIRLQGDAWMMAELTERGSARVRASAVISYTFPTRTFYGEFGITANLEAVQATGRMVLLFSPATWHVKIGDPEGQRIEVAVLNNLIQLRAYFIAGMNLPSMPPIPPEVLELTGPIPAPVRPESIGRGNGFAFGADARFAPPELRFLIFYASMRFLVGFDMALLNYGATAQCSDGRPMGANGWYATGQMYARLDASIGLHVDLFFVSGKFEILGLRVGAALQAGLPNPTWLAGACGGRYSILGGLISGYCNFQFTLGERCTPPTESALANIEIISDIAPANGSTDVPIFAEPTAFFNLQPDRPFALEELQNDGATVTKIFRIRVGSFTLRKQNNRGDFTVSVPVSQPVDRSTREAPARAIVPAEPLEGLTRYRVEVTAYGQEYTGTGFVRQPSESIEQASERAARELAGVTLWRDIRYRSGPRSGQRVEQTVGSTFTTQPRPDTIVPQMVYMAYPRPSQRFYLQGECSGGEILLLNDFSYLFAPSPNRDTVRLYQVRFIRLSTSERTEVPLSYTRYTRPYYNGERRTGQQWGGRIGFSIPRLANDAIYAVQVIRRDSVVRRSSSNRFELALSGMPEARSGVISQQLLDHLGSTLVLRRIRRPSGFDVGRAVASNEKLLYVYYFRTSRYDQLADKVRDLSTQRTDSMNTIALILPVIGLVPSVSSPEGFDPHDLQWQSITASPNGVASYEYEVPPLISTNGWVRSDRWHSQYANAIYEDESWVASLPASSTRRPPTPRGGRTWFSHAVSEGNRMFSAVQTSHQTLSDHEIGAATGDPSYVMVAKLLRQASFRVDESRISQTWRIPIADDIRLTRFVYDQPTWVALDVSRLATWAAGLVSTWCGSGDVGYDQVTCERLRRIAARRFVFPYRGDYTTVWLYSWCQDPDRPVTYQFRFRY
ncbi:MAG: Ig-like domain-containing protein [Chlorobi bacterium]|nr:Ig-like domain-containing protein [Chlorobiota bacterium]